MGYNLKGAKLVVNIVSVAWALIYGYKLLELVHATELLWFMYWGTIPLAVILAILQSLVED